ncbi:uncharacterized protein B0I36DRAFT_379077 [Microdochium trichocladiopsis]|uniref:DUF6594 domain-containing protein n=1 Tax=Microdochium trichocladiopsis TaxID=1682393 RepID=A0A9P9BV61_9PEZI|nr:uncharacterized protein B0I36DRAFT_379077 [Microdochium trichocladiopsis]KAH7040003.1 hypothetical protein B0I36DRAFT_379077 [Microdochium trichocladiopsis]
MATLDIHEPITRASLASHATARPLQQSMPEDIELGRDPYKPVTPARTGYSLWASRLASDRDNEPLIFRKFDSLGALNLLYLQCELLDLEDQLDFLDFLDERQPDIESVRALRDWDVLQAQGGSQLTRSPPGSTHTASPQSAAVIRSKQRLELIASLRTKMKEYQEALLLQSQIARLPAPSNRVLQATKQMFLQDGWPAIQGKARDYLQAGDLVALKGSTQEPISNFLRKQSAREEKGSHTGVGRFEEYRIELWVTLITVLVAIVFLVGPVLALYFTQSRPAKLALVAVFTASFSGSVWLVTGARRAEVFLGTATYAAVLVVFISNSDGLADGTG